MHRFPIYKPIVAAVNGVCVAGGFEMLTSADIRVAVPQARFAVMEPKRGLFAGGGSTVRLPRQLPYALAIELLLTADMVDAERIAVNPPLAVSATKQSAVEGLALDLHSAYANETPHSDRIFATEDAKEGPRAFAEKRPPTWRGR